MRYIEIGTRSNGNANTPEECDEIKSFYKPYLEKYESKYRVLYLLLQQPSLISTHNDTSGITPSLAALNDATSLKQREWIHGEPGGRYSSPIFQYWRMFDP